MATTENTNSNGGIASIGRKRQAGGHNKDNNNHGDDDDARSTSGDTAADHGNGGVIESKMRTPKGPHRLGQLKSASVYNGNKMNNGVNNSGGGGGGNDVDTIPTLTPKKGTPRGPGRAGLLLNPETPARAKTPRTPFVPSPGPGDDVLFIDDEEGENNNDYYVHNNRDAKAGGSDDENNNNNVKPEAPDISLGLDAWVACDACEKWRRIPIGVASRLKAGATWTCSMNPYAGWDDCAVEQELPDNEIDEQLLKSQAAAGLDLQNVQIVAAEMRSALPATGAAKKTKAR